MATTIASVADARAAALCLAREDDFHEHADSIPGEPPIEALWFWEASAYAVVLGRSSHGDADVDRDACLARDVPILRRSSGGGTVLLGPGCLNYSLILSYRSRPELQHVGESYRLILEEVANALAVPGIRQEGTDLTLHGRKFAGCAQRRRRHTILHHGTILYKFDASEAARLLHEPRRQPAHRRGRSHLEFMTNIPVRADFRQALAARFPGVETIP